eukprot:4705514-Amphidinium_carterae.1
MLMQLRFSGLKNETKHQYGTTKSWQIALECKNELPVLSCGILNTHQSAMSSNSVKTNASKVQENITLPKDM